MSVCPANKCNLPCRQIYLEQTVIPTSVTAVGTSTTWTLKATNVSGADIISVVLISSSLLGTLLLSSIGIKSGETITLTANYNITAADAVAKIATSVAFAAYGISTGTPGNFAVGQRISKVVTTSVNVNAPVVTNLQVLTKASANLSLNSIYIEMRNTGTTDIGFFSMEFNGFFSNCNSIVGITGTISTIIPCPAGTTGTCTTGTTGIQLGMFQLMSGAAGITLLNGVIPAGKVVAVTAFGAICTQNCTGGTNCAPNNSCTFPFSYGITSATPITGTNNVTFEITCKL